MRLIADYDHHILSLNGITAERFLQVARNGNGDHFTVHQRTSQRGFQCLYYFLCVKFQRQVQDAVRSGSGTGFRSVLAGKRSVRSSHVAISASERRYVVNTDGSRINLLHIEVNCTENGDRQHALAYNIDRVWA